MTEAERVMPKCEATLLIGHGSKDPEGREEFAAFAQRAGMRHCLFEYAEPSIPTVFAQFEEEGVERVAVIPYFLFAGGHVKHEIPRIIAEERQKYPRMDIRLGRYLGIEERLLRATADRLGPVNGQAILLVGRGSSEPEPIADMATVAQKFAACYRLPLVEHCFIALAPPDLPQGISNCRARGTKAITVVPYFLFTGVLVKRIHRISQEYGCEIRPPLGLHDELIQLVHERRDELWLGS